MNRRQFLLSVVNLDKYKDLLFNSVYFNTIYDADIKDKGKIKLGKVSGNGAIENNLVDYLDMTALTSFGMSASISNGVLKETVIDTTNPLINFDTFESVVGHKYFCSFELKKPYATKVYIIGGASFYLDQTPVANIWTSLSAIYTATNQVSPFTFYPFILDSRQVNDECEIRNFNVIDLTLMFGTGNEPTTLNDNRIQALLNRGYIPYNTGSYKPSIVKEIEMEGYNLLNLDRTAGNTTGWGWDNTEKRQFEEGKYYAGLTANNYFVSVSASVVSISANSMVINSTAGGYGVGLPIRVLGGETYRIEFSSNDVTPPDYRIGWYDKDGALISFNNDTIDKVAPQNAYWGVIVLSPNTANTNIEFSNICFHRTGTRTDYAPYINPIKLNHFTPNKAGSVSDTYKDFVFTRKVGFIDLGSLTWNYASNNVFYVDYNQVKGDTGLGNLPNIYCSKYTTIAAQTASSWLNSETRNNIISLGYDSARIYIRDTTYTDAATFKTAMSGVILYYELATPTTITMANNCLQCVDLGTLTWAKETSSNGVIYFRTYGINNSIAIGENGVYKTYCADFNLLGCINTTVATTSTFPDNSLTQGLGGYAVSIRRSEWDSKTADEVKTLLSGVYLFYETASPLNEYDAGVLTDQMKVTLPKALSLGGAISAHNTFEITKTAYVFTRNVASYTFKGNETWVTENSQFYTSLTLGGLNIKGVPSNTIGNIVCDILATEPQGTLSGGAKYGIAVGVSSSTQAVCIRAQNVSSTSDAQSFMSGQTIRYQLSLPQVTTIARKRLKAVDLGTLTYTYEDGVFKVQISDMITGNPGVNKTFINEYLFELITTLANMGDRHYARNSNWLYIKDTRYNNATNFKNAVSGITLWYETNADVGDLTDKALFEKGGTITTNEFSFNKNQFIANGNFEDTSGWISCNSSYGTLSVANNTVKITMISTTSDDYTFGFRSYDTYQFTSGHKILVAIKMKSSKADNIVFDSNGVLNSIPKLSVSANQWSQFNGITTASGSSQNLWFYANDTSRFAVNDTLEFKDFIIVDLTLAFGAGNEPTSTDDYRIQKILQMGYIPTNTNGTQESVQTETLCNLNVKVQK